MRQMPSGQWVAFDASTDVPHKHNKVTNERKTMPSGGIKSKSSIQLEKEPTQKVAGTYYKQSFTREKSNSNGWLWVIGIIVFLFLIF